MKMNDILQKNYLTIDSDSCSVETGKTKRRRRRKEKILLNDFSNTNESTSNEICLSTKYLTVRDHPIKKKAKKRRTQDNNSLMTTTADSMEKLLTQSKQQKSAPSPVALLFQIPQVDITLATPTTPSLSSLTTSSELFLTTDLTSDDQMIKSWDDRGRKKLPKLNSLMKQTLKVSSMGLRCLSAERLTSHQKFKPLRKHLTRVYSRSTNNVSTIGQTRTFNNATRRASAVASTANLLSSIDNNNNNKNDDNHNNVDDDDDDDAADVNDEINDETISQSQYSNDNDDSDEMQCILYLNGIDQGSESDNNLNRIESTLKPTTTTTTTTSSLPQQKDNRFYRQQFSTPEGGTTTTTIHQKQQLQSLNIINNHSSTRSLKHSNSISGTTPLVVIKGPPTTGSSISGRRSISPYRRSTSSNSCITAKHELLSQAATTAATSASTSVTSITPPEKEKKRKEVSSSRVKKFHRHFSQVSKDEKLINYFSCALVSDILLQGHLYITDKHFAFYSNVFGYVTKVVIPTASVTKISKEKTAKIIPNAVGVATADERHVFGSFISREAAYRLMCSVCPHPLVPIELIPKDPANIEISEEYSIEDDSSCSISGNESPGQVTENSSNTNIIDKITTTTKTTTAVYNDTSQLLLRRNVAFNSSNLSISDGASKQRHSDTPLNAKSSASSNDLSSTRIATRSSAPATSKAHFINSNLSPIHNNNNNNNSKCDSNNIRNSSSFLQTASSSNTTNDTTATTSATGSASSGGTSGLSPHLDVKFVAGTLSTSTSTASTTPSSPTTIITKPGNKFQETFNIFRSVINRLFLRIKYPTEFHVVYTGVILTLFLTVFTIFLLYRILDIEAKTSLYHRSGIEFNWGSGNDDDIFAEALRFQKELQHKSNEEAQNILKTNLEQIAKVRRSLETLSMLISDRSSSFSNAQPLDKHDDITK